MQFMFEETYEVIESLPLVNASVTHESFSSLEFPPELGLDDEFLDTLKFNRKRATFILENFLKKYPGNAVILSWLACCYGLIGQKRRALAILEENYQKNKAVEVFARADYAIHLIKYQNNHTIVPSLFDDTFNLGKLYPERKLFHITEIMVYYHALGLYFVKEGDLTSAQLLLDTLMHLGCNDVDAAEDIVTALRLAKTKQAMKSSLI